MNNPQATELSAVIDRVIQCNPVSEVFALQVPADQGNKIPGAVLTDDALAIGD